MTPRSTLCPCALVLGALLAVPLTPGCGPARRNSASADGEGEGTQIGKRYGNEAGDLEILCTKPGEGSLAAGGALLTIKGAKPRPSSD